MGADLHKGEHVVGLLHRPLCTDRKTVHCVERIRRRAEAAVDALLGEGRDGDAWEEGMRRYEKV